MESGLPILNYLLQQTLRSLCTSSSPPPSDPSHSSKWVYAVFWRIVPRNYPPPRWDYGGSILDRSKGNKRNWILVWEDGFCDSYECQRSGSGFMKGKFGSDVFFKMSHEVYNYGEGLVGKVAADNSHKWVFREVAMENDPNILSPWNGMLDVQPRAWEAQFNSGIQTIAIIAVREGIIQLGSFNKVAEDLNLVINIQRKFNYFQSIPGVLAMQRPLTSQSQHPNGLKINHQMADINRMDYLDDKQHTIVGAKRCYSEGFEELSINKSINLGWNSPQNRVFWPVPPLLPSISCSLGALLSKLPSVVPPNYTHIDTPNSNGNTNSLGQKLVSSLCQIPDLKPNILLHESQTGAVVNGTPNSEHLKMPETKPKIQNPNRSNSWEDPASQFQAQTDEESAPDVLNDVIQ